MRKLLTVILLFAAVVATGSAPKDTYIKIKTTKGECIVKLYNETPRHRDNFLRLVRSGYYNGTLFHRVIPGFMVQGGDQKSRDAKPGQLLGDSDLGYRIPAEFNPELFHKRGALAAARDDNPEKSSSASQFYLVQGSVYTDRELDMIEQTRLNGRKIPAAQREVYKRIGGTPFLDQNYTVFGEIVQGAELLDSIAKMPVDTNDRPLEDISMKLRVLKKREVKKLEKELIKEAFQKNLLMKSQS